MFKSRSERHEWIKYLFHFVYEYKRTNIDHSETWHTDIRAPSTTSTTAIRVRNFPPSSCLLTCPTWWKWNLHSVNVWEVFCVYMYPLLLMHEWTSIALILFILHSSQFSHSLLPSFQKLRMETIKSTCLLPIELNREMIKKIAGRMWNEPTKIFFSPIKNIIYVFGPQFLNKFLVRKRW